MWGGLEEAEEFNVNGGWHGGRKTFELIGVGVDFRFDRVRTVISGPQLPGYVGGG